MSQEDYPRSREVHAKALRPAVSGDFVIRVDPTTSEPKRKRERQRKLIEKKEKRWAGRHTHPPSRKPSRRNPSSALSNPVISTQEEDDETRTREKKSKKKNQELRTLISDGI